MKIALIGATGFVGSAILKEALDRGLSVTVIVRHPEEIHPQDRLTIKKGDIMDTHKLAKTLKEHDVVVSAYNAGWSNPNLYHDYLDGAASIQKAVKESGVKRYLVTGGAGSLFVAPNLQLVDSPEFPSEWKPGALAARDYLTILKRENQLDWTYLSPPIEMNQGTPRTKKGTYRQGLDHPVYDSHHKSSISVDDLAVALLDEIEKPKHIRKRFTVGY